MGKNWEKLNLGNLLVVAACDLTKINANISINVRSLNIGNNRWK